MVPDNEAATTRLPPAKGPSGLFPLPALPGKGRTWENIGATRLR